MLLQIEQCSQLAGEITAPSSKSQSIRGIFFALLAKGKSTIKNVLNSDDVIDTIEVCRQLGADITRSGNDLIIESNGLPIKPRTNLIYSGNSGIATHFVLPILGLRDNGDEPIILDCGNQMRTRPINELIIALEKLGLEIKYLQKTGSLPISVKGNLQGGAVEIETITSQPISALLIALPCVQADSKLLIKNLHERPYIEMTLSWIVRQKLQYSYEKIAEGIEVFNIKGKQSYKHFSNTICGDFSSAANLIAASVLVKSDVILKGINMDDLQGDKRIITILQNMGADIAIQSKQLQIRGGKILHGTKIDAKDIPDLLPILGVIGTQTRGKSIVYNAHHARVKETNRIHSITQGLRDMGAHINETKDGIQVCEGKLKGARLKSYGDHRTVMALSVAGLMAQGTTVVEEYEAVNKTFPNFVETMQALGAQMSTT